MTPLVLGSSGQLASHLRELWPCATFWGREQLDLASVEKIESAVVAAQPPAIVNAAAYTAVDRAEVEADLAWRINADAPAALARAAARLGVPLVHVSTDYVFDGRSDRPYREDDPVAPLNVYGRSKLAGELAVGALCDRHWILRCSWVFSEHGHNFVKTVIRLARERGVLTIVDDQWGRPTYALTLAEVIDALLRRAAKSEPLAYGTYHLGAGPVLNWHQFARAIVDTATSFGVLAEPVQVHATSSSAYAANASGRLATRPARSVLHPSEALSGVNVAQDWTAGLRRCIERIAATRG